ncbi:NADH-quinone oxidoreductase subunit J [Telmatocola sphagniphila]|uniref:NADH-quinone oxidoreductase subunit J n=1 Tax=Telmatocola sphagniphila TaxID=1123043 RepID=A0A8E6EZ10_9BACT|nr:NADH-quinone oxidoreductase subunit J [Telmatocola sphagniphila]QVL33248.1 NADH-quinone oxidoreductase subunit J [Telmatocola sphagniphila]
MTTEAFLFWLLASVIGFTSAGLVLSQNIVRCAIWLLGSLFGIALLYFLLGAEFVGATQLIIYVGGTMVLVVFAVMLTSQQAFLKLKPTLVEFIGIGILGLLIFGLIANTLVAEQKTPMPRHPATGASVGSLGMAFLGLVDQKPNNPSYLFPFEIISIQLLVALIGAAYMARAKRPGTKMEARK